MGGVTPGKEEPLEELFAVDCFTVRLFQDANILAATCICRWQFYNDITKIKKTFWGGWGWGWGGAYLSFYFFNFGEGGWDGRERGWGLSSNSFRWEFVLFTKAQ